MSSDDSNEGRINYKLVILIASLLCLYIGAEVSYGGWIHSYVLKMSLGDENMADYLTSGFWMSLTVGRLICVPLAARLRPRTILLIDLIGCFIATGIAVAWSTSLVAMSIATVLIGLSLGSIYPVALTFGERRMKITGQVMSMFIVGGSVGGMFVPLLVGKLFESIGPRVMIFIVLIDLTVALAVYLLLVFGSFHSTGQNSGNKSTRLRSYRVTARALLQYL